MTTETLIPNASGDENNNNYWDGDNWETGTTNNYQSIDDPVATPDDDTTKIRASGGASVWSRDLYNLPNHSVGSGTINNITIYFRIYGASAAAIGQGKAVLKSDDTITEGTDQSNDTGTWVTKSQTWTQNPDGPANWTWGDIDALQIGVSLYNSLSGKTGTRTICTQVYVVVNYTEAAAGTNMKINIGDVMKDVDSMKINIGDTWKDVAGAQVNIGDTWKTIF